MATQLKTVTNKLFNPTLNLVRHRSRVTVPSLFWDDPFGRHRSMVEDFWRTPNPFEFLSPLHRIARINWEGEKYVSNPKDGFQVSLNVEHFAPNEINVKVIENSILVEAKHEERAEDDTSYISRHFTRRYVLPDEFSVKDVVSTLSSDGILTVKAPPKEVDPENVRNIPIQPTGSPAQGEGEQKK